MIFKKHILLFVIVWACASLAIAQEKDSIRTKPKKDTTLLKRKAIKAAPSSQSNEPKKRTYSKIINDSSKNVYGPKTSKWTTESDLLYNRKNYQPLDTAIRNFHRWTYVQQSGNKYQDLGNMGTALNPIFPVVSTTIGATPGFKSYEPYYDTQEPRYYDTKSPFTRLYVIWGGNGRAMSHIEFSRNINPRWNFGFNYRPILVDKQIQQKGKGDRQTISHYYDFHTTYKSKKDKYLLALNYRRIRHRIKENGGVLLDLRDTTFAAFFDPTAKPYFTTAESEELRNNFHLYQQYQLAKPLQVYQMADYEVRTNTFRIDKSDLGTGFFKQTIIDSIKTTDAMEFKSFQNEMGIKGNAAFLFYDFYYKLRTVNNSIPLLKGFDPRNSSSLLEHYVGGRVAFRFDSLSELRGSAELLLDGNYKLEGALGTPWLDASLTSVLAKPGYLQRAYRGSHNYWLNNFSNTFSNQVKGFLKARWGNLYVNPGVTYTVLTNYLYFAEFKDGLLPMQSSGNQQVFSPEITLSLQFFKRFYIKPQVIYTQLWKNDDNVIRIPELFVNAQLAYENILLNNNLQLHVGVDVHYKSDYQALGYAPDIQSYYLQDTKVVNGFPLVDVFLNAKIKGGRLFVKYHNVMQAGKTSGYMLTYGYPAASNLIDFGFEIPLFD